MNGPVVLKPSFRTSSPPAPCIPSRGPPKRPPKKPPWSAVLRPNEQPPPPARPATGVSGQTPLPSNTRAQRITPKQRRRCTTDKRDCGRKRSLDRSSATPLRQAKFVPRMSPKRIDGHQLRPHLRRQFGVQAASNVNLSELGNSFRSCAGRPRRYRPAN